MVIVAWFVLAWLGLTLLVAWLVACLNLYIMHYIFILEQERLLVESPQI